MIPTIIVVILILSVICIAIPAPVTVSTLRDSAKIFVVVWRTPEGEQVVKAYSDYAEANATYNHYRKIECHCTRDAKIHTITLNG